MDLGKRGYLGCVAGLLCILFLVVALVGCSQDVGSVDPTTFIVIDRQTGTVYHPDLVPAPKVRGSSITFVQDGRAYVLEGNWVIQGELK